MPAKQGTTLADIIVPSAFDPYVIQRTMEVSNLFKSGIVVNDAKFNALASEASPTHNMPFYEDLSGDPEDIIEGNPLTAKKINSSMDVSTTIRRANMWSSTDLSGAMSGSDPAQAIANLVAEYWARQMQKELVNLLGGVFSCATMKDHVLDITAAAKTDAQKICASSFIDACQLLGDAQDLLTGVAMHSATKTYLKKLNLIESERDSTDVEFESYQGRRVIVDDGCPYDADTKIFTTFLFGQGAIAYGEGVPVRFIPTETDRDKKMGSGVDYLINRKCFILHPRGVRWTDAVRANQETTSRAELANGLNWKRVYESKAIRIVAFKHKLG